MASSGPGTTPLYRHDLACGHTVYLGIPALYRHPTERAWCEICRRYERATYKGRAE